jgi:LPXTG-site transpeptidase (sortase) family protein
LRVPSIVLDAPVVQVGVDEQGRMATPSGYEEVGWYAPGPTPGAAGRAVIAGHVDSPSAPAVFYDLGRLQPGELIYVLAADGSELIFRVRETQLYWAADAPVHDIFRPDGPPELVLITCGGEFDRGSAIYLQRRVVYAELVS